MRKSKKRNLNFQIFFKFPRTTKNSKFSEQFILKFLIPPDNREREHRVKSFPGFVPDPQEYLDALPVAEEPFRKLY